MKKQNVGNKVATPLIGGSGVRGESLSMLIAQLGSRDGAERQHARLELIRHGKSAVPLLMESLAGEEYYTRWEAAKALGVIRDPLSARALVNSLIDDYPGVRWLASEALIELKEAALVPLLLGLEEHFDSLWFRQGAHRILHTLSEEEPLNQPCADLLNALSKSEPGEAVALAAGRALASLARGRT